MKTQNIKHNKIHTRRIQMHVISNTHWDREWRQSFQQTRMNLVDVMDKLLEILDNDPSYKFYHLDSQTIVLEDYLAVRPENRARLEKYIRGGRILAGPWYSNPDMNTLTGESIVRNLLMGHRIARSFGRVMKTGYNPFSFGQISQLPQIYAEFGMDVIMFYRGVGRHRAKSEFWWEGPDGTRALCSQLSTRTRHNFYYHVYQFVCESISSGDRQFRWADIPVPAHTCDENGKSQSVYALEHRSKYKQGMIEAGLKNLIKEDEDEFTTEHFLLMQGCDTTAPNPLEPRLIDDCDKILTDCDVFHSNLEEYSDNLKKSVGKVNTLYGEMREPLRDRGAPCLGDVISSRTYLKQANARSMNRLEMWAEPAAVNALLMGGKYPDEFLMLAWKYLLANHAHDSISGCSVDAVHEDMMYRFRQSDQIAEEVIRRSQMEIVRQIDGSNLREGELLLTVFNPLWWPRNEVLTVFLDFDIDEPVKGIEIRDMNDCPVDFQQGILETTQNTVQLRTDWPKIYDSQRIKAHVRLDDIPAGGYKCLKVEPAAKTTEKNDTLVTGPFSMENSYVSVTVAHNGTLEVFHKETGTTYSNCLYFEDCGEAGHAWWHISPQEDKLVTSTGGKARITLLEEGPVRCTFGVNLDMEVPAVSNEQERSTETVKIPIENRITLNVNSPRIEIVTKLDNTARNHRLRVCFPTYIQADVSAAQSAFDVVERAVKKTDRSGWREKVGNIYPKLSFADVSDGTSGFAFIGDRINEYEVLPNESRTLAVTLLRGIEGRRKGFGFPKPENEGPQCLGVRQYSYALYPHSGRWDQAEVINHGHNHSTGLSAIQSGKPGGVLPLEHSFWRLEPKQLMLSCLKQSEDKKSVIVRLYNPTGESVEGLLETAFKISKALRVTMEETVIDEMEVKDRVRIPFDIGPKKVFTLSLFFDKTFYTLKGSKFTCSKS